MIRMIFVPLIFSSLVVAGTAASLGLPMEGVALLMGGIAY